MSAAGGLGVGKTTLARAILRAASRSRIDRPSPTFTLVEVYDTRRGAFWHFDLYRLESPEQVFELGWEEARADGIALVEWGRAAGMLLPAERLTVTLAMEGEGRRADLQGMQGLAISERDRLRARRSPRRLGDAGERLLAGDASFQIFRLSGRALGRGHGCAAAPGGRAALRAHRPAPVGLGLSAPGDPCHRRGQRLPAAGGPGRRHLRVLAAGGEEAELYARATDVLVVLHRAGAQALLPGLGAYAGEALIDAAMLLPEWYLPAASGRPTPDEETTAYRAAWRACLANLPRWPTRCCCATITRTTCCGCQAAPA